LLLDEADAHFAERTEVKNEHDRYANLKVNFLPRVETISPVWWQSRSGSATDHYKGSRLTLSVIVSFPFSVIAAGFDHQKFVKANPGVEKNTRGSDCRACSRHRSGLGTPQRVRSRSGSR
jgi:hypothetical protein